MRLISSLRLSPRVWVQDLVLVKFTVWLRRMVFILAFFFFQAEDGIRDTSVTGVQTCALPIFRRQGRSPQLVGSDNRCRSRNSFGTISSLSSGTRFQRHSNDRVVGPACTGCQHSSRLWMLQTSRGCIGRQRQGIHCRREACCLGDAVLSRTPNWVGRRFMFVTQF